MSPAPKRVLFHPRASRELDAIYAYTREEWGEKQADKYISGLISKSHSLETNQHDWRIFTTSNGRRVIFARYEHHYLFFQDRTEEIFVLAVLHERMDMNGRLNDLLSG